MKKLLKILWALAFINIATGFVISGQEPIINEPNIKIQDENFSVRTVNYNDENYIKLRDFASISKNRLVDFSIVYKNGKILIDTSKFYVAPKDVVYPLEDLDGYKIGKTKLYVNGQEFSLNSINIKNYNYFRLRDLCEIFNVDVYWNKYTKEITLSNNKGVEELDREKNVSFRSTAKFTPLSYSGYETDILEDGSLQIIYSIKVNTGGYTLSTRDVKISDKTIYITPELKGPGPNDMVSQVISYPTASIIIDKSILPENYNIEIIGANSEIADR